MTNYIPADKLITEIESRLKNIRDYINGTRMKYKGPGYYKARGKESAYDALLSITSSIQQEQPIQANTLTWRDINDLERIINNVHYEFRNGIGEKSFGEEVLERFREERDEQEQPKVDLKKFTEEIKTFQGRYKHPESVSIKGAMAFMARMFYQYPNVARQWYEQLPKATMD